jgi:hypothetical protein
MAATISGFDQKSTFGTAQLGCGEWRWLVLEKSDQNARALCLAAHVIHAFRQVQRSGKVAQLHHGQSDLLHSIKPRVELFDGDTLLEGIDDNVFVQVACPLVDKGDHGRVEFVFDGKHTL